MADVAKSSAPEQPDKVDSAAADDDVKMDDAPPSASKDAAPEKTATTEGKYRPPCISAALHTVARLSASFFSDEGAILRLPVCSSASPMSQPN